MRRRLLGRLELKFQAVWDSAGCDADERRNDPGARSQLHHFVRSQHPKHTASSPDPRSNTRRSVFDDNAICGRETEQLRAGHVRFRMRLAVDNVVGRDHTRRKRKPRSFQAAKEQPARSRGNNRPPFRRQRFEKFTSARKYLETFRIDDLEVFNRSKTFMNSSLVEIRS